MCAPPFLIISPGKGRKEPRLEHRGPHRNGGKDPVGARFFVISEGELFTYRSEGKGIVDLIEKSSLRASKLLMRIPIHNII